MGLKVLLTIKIFFINLINVFLGVVGVPILPAGWSKGLWRDSSSAHSSESPLMSSPISVLVTFSEEGWNFALYWDGVLVSGEPELTKSLSLHILQNELVLLREKTNKLLPDRIRKKIKNCGFKVIFFRSISSMAFSSKVTRDGAEVSNQYFFPLCKQESSEQLRVILSESLIGSNDFQRLFAHEFLHIVHYLLNPKEEQWIREGLAQYFEYRVTGFKSNILIKHAMEHPSSSPTQGFRHISSQIDYSGYGNSLLYFSYLIRQCGYDSLFWMLVEGGSEDDSPLQGLRLIDRALKKQNISSPPCQSAQSSLIYFQLAKIHNRAQLRWPYSFEFYLHDIKINPLNIKLEPIKEDDIEDFVPYLINFQVTRRTRSHLVFEVEPGSLSKFPKPITIPNGMGHESKARYIIIYVPEM
ncbi:MAG: hypothetical protein RMK80_08565 [Pseudobdellovibrionaceae bacterium]|nr:hypothetical protein [Pseudobdellovibrionaceae bacterium]